MSPILIKRLQARIEIANNPAFHMSSDHIWVYGPSLYSLRARACEYLRDKKPLLFTNGGDHISGRLTYFYSEGRRENTTDTAQTLEEGWWYSRDEQNTREGFPKDDVKPNRFKDFEEAIQHFARYALIPEKGPDYESNALIDRTLQLQLLEKIVREHHEGSINDLIRRGWHIIALEYLGEVNSAGELTNRKASFVLGHPDVQMATLTLESANYTDVAPFPI